jgi:spore maturation protein CgeB
VKILFVGSLTEGQTSLMRMEVLQELGYDVVPLSTQINWDRAHMVTRRLQQSLGAGPIVEKINKDLIEAVKTARPDVVWAEKQEYFKPDILREISEMGVKLIHYTPDPYFSLSWKQTKLLDSCLPLYDCLITSKKYELDDYRKINRHVVYMQLGYDERVHRPSFPRDSALRHTYASDVSFVGGWEPRREVYLDALVRNVDCSLKVWGYGWEFLQDGHWTPRRWWAMHRNAGGKSFAIRENLLLGKAVQGNEVYGDHYAWALSGAKINIGFLREICPDQHTTRTFEIPACKSLLLADRSNEHLEFFKEGVEADFFSDKEEMNDKVKFYLDNDKVRQKVAINGYKRCHESQYSYTDIMRNTMKKIESIGIF